MARFWLWGVWTLAAAILAAGSLAGAAAPASEEDSPASCSRVDYRTEPVRAGETIATRPPNTVGPTLVGGAFFVTELREIDAVRDDYFFRGYVRTTWCDPRLAFDPAAAGVRERVTVGPAAERRLQEIWNPSGFPVNRAGALEITDRVLRVGHDGNVQQDLNISLRLSADFDLRRFPLDRQTLELQLESFRWPRSEVVFVPDATRTGFGQDFSIPEWHILRVGSRIEESQAIRNEEPFSRYVLEIEVERESGFYVWKIMLPLVIIVALSWTVFWMTEERVAGRSRITATGVLTIVAYQFVVGEDLPRIAYLTLLDKVLILSFVLLAITVVQSIIVARYQDDAMPTAKRIDRASRWLFPLTYAVLLTLVVTLSGR